MTVRTVWSREILVKREGREGGGGKETTAPADKRDGWNYDEHGLEGLG